MRFMKSRRGSTLVLFALMLGALMGVAAIAADIGRFYVVTGELQTSADAAALKGASVLQKLTSNYASSVDDSVGLWARTTNRSARAPVIANPAAREFYEKGGFTVEGEAQTRFGPALRMSR